MERKLEHLFYNLPEATAYTGGHELFHATHKQYPPERVSEWLEKQDAHTLHKPVRHRFPRRPYNPHSPYETFEADLADFRSLKTYNDGYNYILVVIDVLSKRAWVCPLLDKTSKSVAAGLERILSQSRQPPVYFQTDKGKEFVGRDVQEVLKKYGIFYRTARDPDVKAAIAERFIRTLKERIWRFFTHKHTRRYIDVLDNIVEAYNDSWHSGIRMAPSKVTFSNASEARQNLARRYCRRRTRQPKYRVGDLVRVSRARAAFSKAYEGGWTLEIFKIIQVNTFRQPAVYVLEDLSGEKIDGYFYEEQLSRVRKDLKNDTFEIDEILKTKGSGKKKQYFVSWKGYPDSFNSWVSANDLKTV